MFKNIIKKVLISFLIWISIWFGIFISFAANISSISDIPNSWDVLASSWFNDLRNRVINIYSTWSGWNVWIWVPAPTQKLEVNWNIIATWVKTSCIWNCF